MRPEIPAPPLAQDASDPARPARVVPAVKHLKSRLSDLQALFSSITVRYIAEAFIGLDAETSVADALRYMNEHDFDDIGVLRGGVILGYARRTDMRRGKLADHLVEIASDDVIAESTPMKAALAKVAERKRLFVSTSDAITAIVTRGDLQKAPVRAWLFGLISVIEMQLLRIIREEYPAESWRKLLSEGRQSKAEELLGHRKAQETEVDLADCLHITDKIAIVSRSVAFQEVLGCATAKKCEAAFDGLAILRNRLAHAHDIVAGDPGKLAELAEKAEALLSKLESINGNGVSEPVKLSEHHE